MPWVRVGPGLDGLQALHERQARAEKIEVLNMEDFETGLAQLRNVRLGVLVEERENVARGVESTLRIGEHIQLDLSDSLRLKLLIQRNVRVLDAAEHVAEHDEKGE